MMRILAGLALAAGLAIAGSRPADAADCAAEGRIHYLCGPVNVEDMVLTPGASWIIAASDRKGGGLYLIDARAKSWKDLATDFGGPARAPYQDCPRPLTPGEMSPHGIALRPGADGRHTLYVVNHGGRESVEVFELDASGVTPTAKWIGCAVLPAGASGNAVAPLPDGGFVATKFMTANDPRSFQRMMAGEKDGLVYTWRPGEGFEVIPGSQMAGANGVEVWRGYVFANNWPGGRVFRFGPGGQIRSVPVDFLPDNLRRGPDGKILVAGQAMDLKTALACAKPRCPHAWTAVRLDPATMTITPLIHVKGTDAFGDATTAIQVGRELWFGTYLGDRVAWTDLGG